MNSRSYIRRFNILTSFVGDKKRVESMLKDNFTALSDAENMLFGSKYEELVVKPLSSKNRGSCPRREVEGSPFEKARYLEAGEMWGEELSQLSVKLYNNNTLQEGKERVRMNLLIAPSISSTDLLSASEFCKIHPVIANLFSVKIKQ